MLISPDSNPQGLELNQIIEMLYQNQHFKNLLGDLLSKKAATTKLEKFFAQQVRDQLKDISFDQ
jgi:hypothetical protein